MREILKMMERPEGLFDKLSKNMIENSGFLSRVSPPDSVFRIYTNENLTAALAVEGEENHVLFWGSWHDIEIPLELLPKDELFTSACPPHVIEKLKKHFRLDGEWPCWYYLAPDGYGPGPWDELGPLNQEDVPFVAKYWELHDDPEPHIGNRVAKFDSACVRVDGKPVSWCGLHHEIGNVGNMGFAHTLDEHRRKGYAAMVTKALVNRLAKRGMRATSHVIKDNKASIALSQSLGFEVVGEATWALFKKD
jgi:ribosomal protein S18 acetylase RimI-like enzyme